MVVAVLAATWVGLFSFLSANATFGTVDDLQVRYIPEVEPLELDLPDLSRLSEVYTADGVLLGKLTERNSQPVPLDEIPEIVIHAVLAAEDSQFYEHEGIDFRAIVRAAIEDIKGGARQGGSTITQQVVKQNFVTDEQTIDRKIREAVIAAELETRYTKDEILEFYLNSVFFGSNAYGVKAAAQEFFNKDLDELTIAEAAALMTPIRNPTRYDPRRRPATVTRARNAVIDNMVANGFITLAQGEAAKSDELRTAPRSEAREISPEVMIAAREQLLNDPTYGLGDTFLQRKRALFGCPASDTECEGGGGLRVFLTVDLGLQREAERILREWFPVGDEESLPTGAIAMVENASGAIRVMAGGLDFGEDLESGQRPYDLAGKGRQNTGSSSKPFGLIAALENGWTLNSYWDYTSPQILEFGGTEPWNCGNFSGGGEGIRSLESALVASTNTVFCQLSLTVGPENIKDVMQRAGITSPLNPVPSIVLGTQAVSPLEMASAYSTIANMGTQVDSYLIERIVAADGSVIYQHQATPEQVFDEALMAAVRNTMQQVVARGTGTRSRLDDGREQAGKTGTHQNFTDVWYVGFIPQYTTAVWVGHADRQIEMRDIVVGPERDFYRVASSSRIPAPIWKQFMEIVVVDLPIVSWPDDPEGTSAYYAAQRTEVPDALEVADEEGVINPDLKDLKSLFYKAGLDLEIEYINSTEPENTFLTQDPEPGTAINQGKPVKIEISNGEPPEIELPNWIGLDLDGLNTELARLIEEFDVALEWVSDTQEVGDPAFIGRIVATAPAAGTIVLHGDTITVFWGIPQSGLGDG